jgi:hypothetical protein
LKVHVKQNLNRISEFLLDYNKLLLDSDCTTDFEDVENMLDNKSIISTTFDSAENVLCNLFYNEEYNEDECYSENDFEKDSIFSDDSNDTSSKLE